MRPVLFGLLQLVTAAGAAAGVYLLAGLAWSLVIVCGSVFVLATAVEMMNARPAPPPRPRLDPADLQPPRVTELPGAARSRPRKEA
jgi:hypothetical protein